MARRPQAVIASAAAPTSEPATATTPTPSGPRARRDPRIWIYGALDLVFAAAYAIAIVKVIPNRLLSASIHLLLIPVATAAAGAGMFVGGRRGWQLAVGGASSVLALTILLIARMLISAAFLAGVYGAFGKGAASFALIAVALVVELVALLPIVQVKFLMSRVGRRAFGLAPRAARAARAAR